MTLVIAKKIEDEIIILSDTKFTYDNDKSYKLLYSNADEYIGGLKAVLIFPGVCVCFAGKVAFARDAFLEIIEKTVNVFDKNILINHFLAFHKKSGQSTDFLIMTNTGTLEIFKIQNGKVTWDEDSVWIGDHEAFSEFQKCFLGNSQNEGEVGKAEFEIFSYGNDINSSVSDSFSKNIKAFNSVLKSNILSVGGICTVIRFNLNKAYYLEYSKANGTPRIALNGKNIYLGKEPEGAFAFHVAPRSSIGLGVFAVYYYTGKFGIIYAPVFNFSPQIIKDLEFEDFSKMLNEKLDTSFKAMLDFQNKIQSK